MASLVLTDLTPRYPDGTDLGLYPYNGQLAGGSPPAGLIDSQTVTAGSVTFTGLTEGTSYWAIGLVGSSYRWLAANVPEDPLFPPDTEIVRGKDLRAVFDGADGLFASDAEVAAEIATHAADTSSVHGIADTSALVTAAVTDALDTRLDSVESGRVVVEAPTGVAATDTAALQAAINAGDAVGGKVTPRPGTYRTNVKLAWAGVCEIELGDGVVIDGQDLGVGGTVLEVKGSVVRTSDLAANAAEAAITLTLAAGEGANYAAGDFVKVRSEAFFEQFTAEGTNVGEIIEVDSVAGDVLTLVSPLRRGPYDLADTAKVDKLSLADHPVLSGAGTIRGGGAAESHRAVVAEKTIGLKIDGQIKVRGCENVAYHLVDCIEFEVWSPNVVGSNGANTGYAINVVDASQDGKVYGGFARDCRHACTTGSSTGGYGVPTDIKVFFMTAKDTLATGDCFDTHAMGDGIWYIGCTSLDSGNNGFNIECPRAYVIDGDVQRCANHAFHFHNEGDAPAEYKCSGRAGAVGNMGLRWDMSTGSSEIRSAEFDVNLYRCTEQSIAFINATANRLKNATLRAIVDEPLDTINTVQIEVAQDLTLDVIFSKVPATAHCYRLTDVKDSSVAGHGRYLSTSTGRYVQGESLDNVLFDGNGCPNGGRGISLDDASTDCKIGSTNDFRGCTTQYVLGAGTGHTWDPAIADVGGVQTIATDAAFSLTPFSAPAISLHTGTLTADRAVTLNTTNAVRGMRYRIARTGPGAFNLNIGTGPLIALAQNEWCEVVYTGTAWALSAAGSLT